MISLDAVAQPDADRLLSLPALCALRARGAFCGSVRTVYPKGNYIRKTTKALLVGSYVDAYFSSCAELDAFTANHADELYTKKGDLAERLYTNKNYLAQTIKLKLNKNFCQLVHYYRVREAMRLYAQNPELTITQLCRRVGFNSMTTFNTAFGRNTGFTPAEWCKEFRKRNESKTPSQ